MRRIAHLSDVHLLDARVGTRRARYRVATRLVGQGRAIDPAARARKLTRALALAKASGADHVVISGDLTEVGEQVEFEHFAEVLHESEFSADSITLVPGNHDAYTSGDAWARAIEGPLARFAATSAAPAHAPLRVVDRGEVVFLPIDSTRFQTIAWSGGVFTRTMADAIAKQIEDPALARKALVLVLHHPPFYPRASAVMRWIDGLRGCAEVLELLGRHSRLQLLHGHLHRVIDRIVASSGTTSGTTFSPTRSGSTLARRSTPATRVFGAPATCDDPEEGSRIRLYDVVGGALWAAPAA